jgi:hypothetical protein
VAGNLVVQALEVKNQSSLSRGVEGCLLVHVNFLPYRGSSTKPRELMASLNINISLMLPPGLFLFSGLRKKVEISNKEPVLISIVFVLISIVSSLWFLRSFEKLGRFSLGREEPARPVLLDGFATT